MTPALVLWLAATMAVFVLANTLLRFHAGQPSLWLVGPALVLFTAGNLMMVRLMRDSGLAVAISVSSILQLLLIAGVAWALFGERPTPLQWTGMALGVVAVAMIAWPRGAGP